MKGRFAPLIVANCAAALLAFAARGAFTLHADVLRGVNTHHKIEALFKALALALRRACRVEGQDLPSTKGTLTE